MKEKIDFYLKNLYNSLNKIILMNAQLKILSWANLWVHKSYRKVYNCINEFIYFINIKIRVYKKWEKIKKDKYHQWIEDIWPLIGILSVTIFVILVYISLITSVSFFLLSEFS